MRMPMAVRKAIYRLNARRDKSMETRFATDDNIRCVDSLMRDIASGLSSKLDRDVTMRIVKDAITPDRIRIVRYVFDSAITPQSSDDPAGNFGIDIVFTARTVMCNQINYNSARDHGFMRSVTSIVSAAICGRDLGRSAE